MLLPGSYLGWADPLCSSAGPSPPRTQREREREVDAVDEFAHVRRAATVGGGGLTLHRGRLILDTSRPGTEPPPPTFDAHHPSRSPSRPPLLRACHVHLPKTAPSLPLLLLTLFLVALPVLVSLWSWRKTAVEDEA